MATTDRVTCGGKGRRMHAHRGIEASSSVSFAPPDPKAIPVRIIRRAQHSYAHSCSFSSISFINAARPVHIRQYFLCCRPAVTDITADNTMNGLVEGFAGFWQVTSPTPCWRLIEFLRELSRDLGFVGQLCRELVGARRIRRR